MSKKKEKSKEQGPQPKLDKHYNIVETEKKLQDLWASKEHYKEIYSFDFEDTEKPLFAIDTPPPFTSGILTFYKRNSTYGTHLLDVNI
ncbi:MAG: hypothetical protein ACTSPC_01295 [Candidatus Heimdallarchaeota archaeon]